MKFKLIALILALTVSTWAQTSNAQPATGDKPAASEESRSCCDHLKGTAKDGMSCCHHKANADAKAAMSCCKHEGKEGGCCSGKDGKSCMKAGKDKTASCCGSDCCKEGAGCCKDGAACCNKSNKDPKAATKCCEGTMCARHAHAGGM